MAEVALFLIAGVQWAMCAWNVPYFPNATNIAAAAFCGAMALFTTILALRSLN